jgi:hypothetical protein
MCLLVVYLSSYCFRSGPMVNSRMKYLRFNLGPGKTGASFPIVIVSAVSIIVTIPARAHLYRALQHLLISIACVPPTGKTRLHCSEA